MRLLINPDAKIYRSIPPIALAYLATYLKAKVIDQNTLPEPSDRFMNIKADEIGIFVRSISYSESKRIATLYKDRFPKAKIKSIYTPIDVQCCYPTLQFDKQITLEKMFGDDYPFPDYSLFDSYETFLSHWQNGNWPYGILTSVGCPYQCFYCAARNRGWQSRSAKNSVEELKFAKKKYKIVSFEILDDAFNVDKKRVLEFCKLVKPLKLKWICANGLRADLFDEEEAKAMSDAGCFSVSFGVESTDPEVLKNTKKGETIEQISKAIDIANKYFKNVNGFFIIGLPNSTYQKDLKSVEWMVKKGITGVFSYYVPINSKTKNVNEEIFFGEDATPQSNEYSKSLQEKVYNMTEFMKGPTTFINFLPRTISLLTLTWKFDKKSLPKVILTNVKKLI